LTTAAGALTVFRPQAVARLVSGTGFTPDTLVVRILGGRQLLQGTAVLIRPTPALVLGAAVVDVLHATSMIAAALIWPRYRRAALGSAAVAGASAAAGALILCGALR
jgi:hypothetical protein